MSSRRRVVVTGMGVVSPLGLDETALWQNMIAGKTGIAAVRALDTTELKTKAGAEVDDTKLSAAMQAIGIPPADRTVNMALVASDQALKQAGVIQGNAPYPATHMAAIFGSSMSAQRTLYETFMSFSQKGVRGIRPTSIPRAMPNVVSAQLSMRFHLTGPNYVTACACTSSTTAIGIAFRMLQDGYADKALCGGADTPFDPFMFGAWNNLGVMSRNQYPEKACRPFDAARDGCILGEGAGALVLETLDSALARNARIRAELCGYGESSDAGHITAPSPEGQAMCIKAALESADAKPSDVGYINCHGTATEANDECESKSIRLALGDAASVIPAGSSKSYFGHLLGASGALELIVTILGLENRKVPPNLNLDNPDPACNLMLVGRSGLEVSSPVAMKNSFGFGGNNAVLIVKRWEG